MGVSLKSNFALVVFRQNLPKIHISTPKSTNHVFITLCGLRNGPRKQMWRSRVLSTEAIQAVQALKLAKPSPMKLDEVFGGRLSRLLKADLLDALEELQRQNELDLALKFVRKEVWYKPDLSLYSDMIRLLGKNNLLEMAEELFRELKEEGLEPNTRVFTEMIGAYIQLGMVEKTMETYGLMKTSGCAPEKLTFTILIRNLEKVGEEEMAAELKKECLEYINYPEKFLEEVERSKHRKRRTLRLV
ncbi:pentatricopeptide repeat-containing protein At1g62350 isoform X2 [Morus notabilis]|uniref:pentatricopeptide repeat-containing protein At1g62350 isoform X2 n=1 Tax=Morus notabilis TaxID=981085 RepID=UPI000CED3ADD|nr:pentatricopeptide repeat-containing protein At1g62350 isoform X2 [Morus notabilis]